MTVRKIKISGGSLPPDFFARPTGKKGRPSRANLPAGLQTFAQRVAGDVFRKEAALGAKRGDLAKAIRAVSMRRRISEQNVKQYVKRYHDERLAQHLFRTMANDVDEIDRRMLGVPDDVREKLKSAGYRALLQFLRHHNIDGTCPAWLIEAVRSEDFLSPT